MTQTIIATFDSRSDANDAVQDLVEAGISRADIQLHSPEEMDSTAGTTTTAAGHEPHGFFERIEHFFSNLVGEKDTRPAEFGHYQEALRRGGALLSIDVRDDADMALVHRVVNDAGAVDIDERATQWQSSGYAPYATGSTGSSQDMAPGQTLAAGQTMSSADYTAATNTATTAPSSIAGASAAGLGMGTDRDLASTTVTGEQAFPVVEEELAVGKRTVQTGAYRVYTRPVETQVSEDVTLREERATIERRPVDRVATDADLKAGFIEVKETDETAVVQKNARVVEEVVVGKESSQRTETIHETLHGTEVEVERVEGDARLPQDGAVKSNRP